MKYAAIVIGAGLGGLTAGAKLAKEGRKVLLLERHYVVGGCATVFKRHGYRVEVGLHEMDGLDDDDPKREIFEELGVFDNVELVKVPEFYRFVKGGLDVIAPHDARAAIEVFCAAFPNERKGIEKFFRVMENISREVRSIPTAPWKFLIALPLLPFTCPTVLLNTFKSVGALLDACMTDENLKMALTANLAYYHDDPYTMSLIFYSLAQMSYFTGGGWYVKGGSQNLSNHLARVITDNGGEIKLRHEAVRIITDKGRAAGVEFRRVSGEGSATHVAEADVIVANAAIPAVVNRLAPDAFPEKFKRKVNALEPACSLLSVYLGFKRPVRELGNRCYSTIIFDDNVGTLRELYDPAAKDFLEKGFVFVDYSQIDSGLAPEGKSLGVIATIDYLSNWTGLTDAEYKEKKERAAARLIDRLERVIPGVKNEIEYVEAGTPKTIVEFTANPAGSVYGFAQTPKQAGLFRLPNRSPVKGLYFASAWAMPGGGFTGAILSGWFCAKDILRK